MEESKDDKKKFLAVTSNPTSAKREDTAYNPNRKLNSQETAILLICVFAVGLNNCLYLMPAALLPQFVRVNH